MQPNAGLQRPTHPFPSRANFKSKLLILVGCILRILLDSYYEGLKTGAAGRGWRTDHNSAKATQCGGKSGKMVLSRKYFPPYLLNGARVRSINLLLLRLFQRIAERLQRDAPLLALDMLIDFPGNAYSRMPCHFAGCFHVCPN